MDEKIKKLEQRIKDLEMENAAIMLRLYVLENQKFANPYKQPDYWGYRSIPIWCKHE